VLADGGVSGSTCRPVETLVLDGAELDKRRADEAIDGPPDRAGASGHGLAHLAAGTARRRHLAADRREGRLAEMGPTDGGTGWMRQRPVQLEALVRGLTDAVGQL